MTERQPEPLPDADPGWEPVPPGYLDRPEVKEAVDWALAQVGKESDRKGMGPDELRALADEHRKMAPPEGR